MALPSSGLSSDVLRDLPGHLTPVARANTRQQRPVFWPGRSKVFDPFQGLWAIVQPVRLSYNNAAG
jgi:hypothetical protein